MNKLEILEGLFRYNIAGNIVDYQVSFDVTGKVYTSKALVYDLPASAQRLILGEDEEELAMQIERFRKLIPIILPLGIVNRNTFFNTELTTIQKQIDQWLAEKKHSRVRLYKLAEPETLAYYILSSFQAKSLYPDEFTSLWRKVVALIEKRNADPSTHYMIDLGRSFPHFAFNNNA
ncbi:MAG: hypothetical protein AAF361_04020 [Bacteroidota bacterium]